MYKSRIFKSNYIWLYIAHVGADFDVLLEEGRPNFAQLWEPGDLVARARRVSLWRDLQVGGKADAPGIRVALALGAAAAALPGRGRGEDGLVAARHASGPVRRGPKAPRARHTLYLVLEATVGISLD